MVNSSLLFTISGTTPAAAGHAVLGSVIDFTTLPADATQAGLEVVDDLDVIAQLVGATGGTLDLCLQTSPDNTTFTDYAHFAQLAAGATALIVRFGVTRMAQQTTIATVGQSSTAIVLAAGTVVGGPVARYMRCLAIAGASTSAGAAISIALRASGRRKALGG